MKTKNNILYFSILHIRKLMFLFTFSLSINALAQSVGNYHVSPHGLNSNDGSLSKPLQTIEEAIKRVKPGGIIFILNGTYRTDSYIPVLNIGIAGSPGKYITIKPYPGHSPVITAGGDAFNAMVIDGSYIIIDGLEFFGENDKLDLPGATKAFEERRDNVSGAKGKYNTNAISIGKESTAHHIIIRNCKVHDFPAGGIGVGSADYVTIENNIVYNNSWYTMYGTSGISILGPMPVDHLTDYKLFVRGNICYNNKTQVPWLSANNIINGEYKLSDGNGIIIDVNNGEQGTPIYTGRTLVENNISYNNGGSGLHAYKSNHVDFINNTAYNNGTVVGYPEIFGSGGNDVKIYNNIMYARSGGNCNANDEAAVYNHNLYFNGPAYRKGDTDIIGDPQFVNMALNSTANFRLKNSSPCIDTGAKKNGQFSISDILSIARNLGTSSDRGAYEFQGTPASIPETTPAIQNIYKDALDAEWSDNVSFGGIKNMNYGTIVKEGSNSISFNYSSPYGGLSFSRNTSLSTVNVAAFKFWVYAKSVQTLKFKTQSDFTSGSSTEVSFTTQANAWKEINITMNQLGNPSIIKRIFFTVNNFTGEFLFDDIRFIPVNPTIVAGNLLNISDRTLATSDQKNVLVYPNPSNEKLNIEFNTPIENDSTIELVSPSSQIVRKATYVSNIITSIDLSGLAKGIYFLRITTNGIKTSVEKIIID